MSQPFDRAAHVPPPGQLDHELGEFWVSNPWDIVRAGHNLSAFERNRTFLNVRGHGFLDISHLTGADSDGDGRAAIAADFRNIGRLDLVVRQVGGGPLLLFENDFPQRHFLKVSLRGTTSNRLGIGARLTAYVHGQPLVRDMFPVNSHNSQMPNVAHFGLGDVSRVDKLHIRWPSGQLQEIVDVAGDRHIVVTEGQAGTAAVETVSPGQTIRP